MYQANKLENTVKITEIVKNKKKDPRYLEIKVDEEFSQDVGVLTNVIDERNKQPKDVGRPLLVNMHCARGVSALSRGREHSNYRGIVTVLIMLLIISNLRFIYKQVIRKGEVFTDQFILLLTNREEIVTVNGIFEILYALHWMITIPLISFIIECHIGPKIAISRMFYFSLVILNL